MRETGFEKGRFRTRMRECVRVKIKGKKNVKLRERENEYWRM